MPQEMEGELPVLPVAEDVYAALSAAAAAKESKGLAHLPPRSLQAV